MAQDLTKNPQIAELVRDFFYDHVAQGNEREVEVERLSLDGTTLDFRIRIRHRHVWPLPFGKKAVAYDETMYAEGKADIVNPSPADVNLRFTVPVLGEISVTIEDLLKIIGPLV